MWYGFCEQKVKKLVKGLEFLDKKIGEYLEFRPNPKSYKLSNDEFLYAEAFYIGIRVRGGVIPKKDNIDLTDTRRFFYEKFQLSIE